ncbi:MAG: cellulase family glycosylhydrolase [Defluviitaleaceae bacterium]|nr:cellulase family glycosylhydrolase [Defluviitaleaceae bacterium]
MKKRTLIIGIAAGALVLAAVVALFFIFNNRFGNADDKTVADNNGGDQTVDGSETNEPGDSLVPDWINPDKTVEVVHAYEMHKTDFVSPLAFYTGKVMRVFGDETKLETADIEHLIADSYVKSINGDLTLNFEDAYLVIETEKAQGITGFLDKAKKDFSDVIIETQNYYGSVVVVSVDNKPLADSELILIQTMTDEKVYGFTTEVITEGRSDTGTGRIIDKNLIVAVGGGMMQVRLIEAAVTLKNKTHGYFAVLNENGYIKELLQHELTDEGLRINIPEDAIYVLYSPEPFAQPVYEPVVNDTYIWWEGEDYIETNFPHSTSYFGIHTAGPDDNFDILSGGNWLSIGGWVDDSVTMIAKYEIEVKESAEYTLYSRKFWLHGPFYWSFNGGDKTECGWDLTLLDSIEIRKWLGANWVYLGEVFLEAGTHIFEIEMKRDLELSGDGMRNYAAGFDCFLLTVEPFVPAGKRKPDEPQLKPEEGFFAFEPGYDRFGEAALDLRFLNDEYAGIHGFIMADGENFIYENRMPVRFWGVNTGHETLNASKNNLDYMAKVLAKRGVNLIRIHGAGFTMMSDRSSVVDQNDLDKLHYFIYAMGNAGIYTHISIYFPIWYSFGSHSGYPGYDQTSNKHPFMLLQFDPDFQAAYKNAVRIIFETVNPYTGIAIKDDPSVAFFEIQNEDNYFFYTFSPENMPDVYFRVLEKQFGDWLIKKYGSFDDMMAAWHNQKDSRDDLHEGIVGLKSAYNMVYNANGFLKARLTDQLIFLTESQRNFYAEINRFIKEDLQSKILVVAGNWTTSNPKVLEALERYTYETSDVIDRHGYFEPSIHQGDGRQGYSVNPGDKYVDTTGLDMPDQLPLKYVQNYGMPAMLSEINWNNPNKYKAEFPILLASYASLNGLDAPILFALGTQFDRVTNKFALFTPTGVGQFPAAALIYRNAYVRETGPVVIETLDLDDLFSFKGSFVNEDYNLDMFRAMMGE